jgi:hypothetical protein
MRVHSRPPPQSKWGLPDFDPIKPLRHRNASRERPAKGSGVEFRGAGEGGDKLVKIVVVMAGLVLAIHDLPRRQAQRRGCPTQGRA